jgi:hypothetical protein
VNIPCIYPGKEESMKRKESSRLGDLQAEGNLGNERTRGSESRRREKMRSHSSEGRMRERIREREDRESGDEGSRSDIDDDTDVPGRSER